VPMLRVIIIDNASADDSVEVARRFAAMDPRVLVIEHQINMGHTFSYNEGIDLARAEYMTFVCADDVLAPGSLSRALDCLEANRSVSIARGREGIFRSGLDLSASNSPQDSSWRLIAGCKFIKQICARPLATAAGGALVRTCVQKKVGYYDGDLQLSDDLEMLLRLAATGDVAETDAIQGWRREHEKNRAKVVWSDFARRISVTRDAIESFLSKSGSPQADAEPLRRLARANLGAAAYWSAISHLLRGKPVACAQLLALAFRLSPRLIAVPPIGVLWARRDRAARFVQMLGETVRLRRRTPA
jgi:glycosyltransferase involved in cell wall biosynthesis